MPIHDHNFLAAIARHLFHRLIEQRELRAQTVGNGARFLLRLKYLPEVVLRKHDGVFLLDCIDHRVAHIQQIGAQWARWGPCFSRIPNGSTHTPCAC